MTALGRPQVESGHFVRRQGARLVLEGKPFYFNGFCNYYMLTRAADKRGSGRKEVHNSAHTKTAIQLVFYRLCWLHITQTLCTCCVFLLVPKVTVRFLLLTCRRTMQVIQTLQKAQELGFTVLRMWAFADGPEEWNALQPHLDSFDEDIFSCARSEPRC